MCVACVFLFGAIEQGKKRLFDPATKRGKNKAPEWRKDRQRAGVRVRVIASRLPFLLLLRFFFPSLILSCCYSRSFSAVRRVIFRAPEND